MEDIIRSNSKRYQNKNKIKDKKKCNKNKKISQKAKK